MAIDDRARLDLYQRLEEVLGPEPAATMMAHLPPSGWGDVATKADLALMASGLRADLEAQINGLRAEMHREFGAVRTEMQQEIGSLRTEMHREFGAVRAEMQQEIGSLRAEMHRSQRQLTVSLVGMMTVMNSALVAVVAALG